MQSMKSYTNTQKGKKASSGSRPRQDGKRSEATVVDQGYNFLTPVRALRRKLRYFEPAITIISGVNLVGSYVFSANNLFKPNVTAAGHQPMPYDQIMAYYEHYIVHSCKIKLLPVTSAAGPIFVSVSRNAGATPLTIYSELVENGEIVYQVLPTGAIQSQFFKMELGLDIARFGGVDDILDNSDYRGAIGTGPVEQSYFHIGVWNPFTVATLSASFSVELEFDATFVEPKKLIGS